MTFYDAQCGIPLFKAPKGRSMEAFETESRRHGWPSFRDEELVKENIEIRDGGEVVSKCALLANPGRDGRDPLADRTGTENQGRKAEEKIRPGAPLRGHGNSFIGRKR